MLLWNCQCHTVSPTIQSIVHIFDGQYQRKPLTVFKDEKRINIEWGLKACQYLGKFTLPTPETPVIAMALHSWASRYSKVVFTSFESFFGSPRSPDSSLQSIVSPRLISSVEFRIPHSPSDCTLSFKVSSGTVTHSAAFSRTVWARFLPFTSKPFKKIEGSRNWRWIKMNLAYDSEGRFAFFWPLAKWGSVVN